MNRTMRIAWVFLALSLLLIPVSQAGTGNTRPWLPELLKKDSITIVVTDSGLGGLSVVADAAEKFRQNPVFESVELVFVNALFSNEGGYNSLQTRDEKLQVFSNALHGMQDRYDPDLILVACNTLSVLLPDTEFARTSQVPVVGIVEDGVEQIAQQLRDKPAARNILFATRGTVDDGTHKDLLLDMGLADEQVVTQACPQLTLYIEQGYDSMYTQMLIDAYVDEALSGMGDIDGPLSISLNCTHFGYALEAWKQAFESRGIEVQAVLNPNTQMVDFLLGDARFEQTGIEVRVVSMIDIPADRRESIGRYLDGVSPATAAALRGFKQVPDLFVWQDLATGTTE